MHLFDSVGNGPCHIKDELYQWVALHASPDIIFRTQGMLLHRCPICQCVPVELCACVLLELYFKVIKQREAQAPVVGFVDDGALHDFSDVGDMPTTITTTAGTPYDPTLAQPLVGDTFVYH